MRTITTKKFEKLSAWLNTFPQIGPVKDMFKNRNDSKEDINHSSAQIRNIEKNALEGYISPNKAKNEISKLITLINELNIK